MLPPEGVLTILSAMLSEAGSPENFCRDLMLNPIDIVKAEGAIEIWGNLSYPGLQKNNNQGIVLVLTRRPLENLWRKMAQNFRVFKLAS